MIEVIDAADRLPERFRQPLHVAMAESIEFDKVRRRQALQTRPAPESRLLMLCVSAQVDVKSPSGKMLARQLSMKIEAGHSLLVTGPNGSGKSSVVRVLGALWPLTSGTAARPGELPGGRKGIFYVPQKPYTTVGTLREQVNGPS